jgi:hypothetical protein
VLEEIAIKSGLGVVLNSQNQVMEYLNKAIQDYSSEPDQEKLSQFGVKRQVERICEVLAN